MQGGTTYQGLRAPYDPEEEATKRAQKMAMKKQAQLKALMYAKYLTMYGGDPATMQGILGYQGGYGGPRPGPGTRGG